MATRVLGVLAGDRTDPRLVSHWAASADSILAADAGADLLLAAGRKADVIVGDMDSISEAARSSAAQLVDAPDQETSDCDKLLRLVASLGHTGVTLIGGEGSRIDHMLAAFQSAAKANVRVRFVFETELADVLVGPTGISFHHEGLLSLLPLTSCHGVALAGVRWPLAEVNFDALGRNSLSNEGLGEVTIRLKTGAAVLFRSSSGEPVWED